MPTIDERIDAALAAAATAQPNEKAKHEALAASLQADAELQRTLGDWASGDTPLVLLPVRIETRFQAEPDPQLWVRIFADDIHIDAHEPELIAEEHEAAAQFWHALWRTGTGDDPADVARRSALRREIASRFGRARADWIVTATSPTNPTDRPAQSVAAGVELNPPPALGAVTIVDEDWTRPAMARGLPERWVVLGHRGGDRVLTAVGDPVKGPLAVGIDPSGPEVLDNDSAVDAGTRWVVDFDEAQQVGMGMKIDISEQDLETGFDTLLVLGVGNPSATSDGLADLLDAHRYSDELAFVSAGAATNNTTDDDAAFRSNGEHVDVFRAERVTVEANSNSADLARALAVDPSVLAALPAADGRHNEWQRAMNTALWPATGGYFLDRFIPNAVELPTTQARRHFIDHVRPGGPLSTIRIGQQPYGVLPVQSLNDSLEHPPGDRDGFPGAARQLWPMWREASSAVPNAAGSVDRSQEDAENLLLDVLKGSALSASLEARPVFAADVFNASVVFPDQDPPTIAQRRSRVQAVFAELGLPPRQPLGDTVVSRTSFPISFDASNSSEGDPTPSAYIDWLLSATVESLRAETDLPGGAAPPKTLLHILLRHSLLLAYGKAAFEVQLAAGTVGPQDGTDPSRVDIVDPDTLTIGRHAETDLPGLAGLAVHELTANHHPAGQELDEMRDALGSLQTLSPTALDHLFISTLDAFSYRLDVWVTSAANRRLAELRDGGTKRPGVVGGFGWLANVRRAPAPDIVEDRPDIAGTLHRQPGNAGYVHTPSMAQAATAAVMRSGYLASTGEDDQRPLAIDLHSARLYPAVQLLEGVRNGQELGDLLGYRFERSLHDRGLDRFISDFRRLTPLGHVFALEARALRMGSGIVRPTPAEEVTIAALRAEAAAIVEALRQEHQFPPDATREEMADTLALSVVDGAMLIEAWRADGGFGSWIPVPPSEHVDLPRTGPEFDALNAAFAELDDAVDAAADLLTAESIHQLVAGSATRTGESLDAVLRGESPPAEFDVIRTPRSGRAVTHRIVVVVDDTAPDANWPRTPMDVMAATEPRLDRLAGQMLGDPTSCVVRARFVSSDDSLIHEESASLFDLDLGALEVLQLASSGEASFLAAIEGYLYHELMVLNRPSGVPDDAVLHLDLARSDDAAFGTFSPSEFATLAVSVSGALLGSRPIERRDLSVDEPSIGTVDVDELAERVNAAVAALDALVDTARDLLAQPDSVTEQQWMQVLRRLAKFGIAVASPQPNVESSADRTSEATDEAERRLGAARAVATAPTGLSPEHEVERHSAIARAIFGEGFVVMAAFAAANGDELTATFANSTQLQQGDELASLEWFADVATVRENVARFNQATQFAGLLHERTVLSLRVGQLPHQEPDRWMALPIAGLDDNEASLSLVAHMPQPINFQNAIAGVTIDEWTEIVPSAAETTGLSFHYDQPGTEAPNAILIAVTAEDTPNWDFVQLEKTLLETFELARMRAVDPELLFEQTDLDQVLPAIYLGLNLEAETVSSDLRRLKPTDP